MSDKLKIYIDNAEVDTTGEDSHVTISYKLEDNTNFQSKQSASALSITLPASLQNDKISNTYHQPSIEDLTSGEAFKSARKAAIEAGGYELLVGKAFLTSAKHTDVPTSYEYDFYGDNADCFIALQDVTLFDVLKNITFPFTAAEIMASWTFDGRDEAKPYVFAPVRYGQQMDDGVANVVQLPAPVIKDYSMAPEYMKPALSVYWIIYWGFKYVGYKINSGFFETNYFRRLVMPWTWGNFLYSDGTQTDNLRFLAKSTGAVTIAQDFTGIMDLLVSNDSTNGAFDTNDTYRYNTTTKEMTWTYLPAFDYSKLEAMFHLQMQYDYIATDSGDVEARVRWYLTRAGVTTRIVSGKPNENSNGDLIFQYSAPTIGGNRDAQIIDIRQSIPVQANDVVTAKFYGHLNDTSFGTSHMTMDVIAYEIEFFRVPLGATINFSNYLSFKKYKFLDLFAGIVDCFNLIPKADSISKMITIEPQHAYSLTSNMSLTLPGYFNGDYIDWTDKQDLSVESTMELFRDYNRELLFKFKDDSSDGVVKIVQDRNTVTLAAAKYQLPDRFSKDSTQVENRFYSPVMHYNVAQWKTIGTLLDAPQMICMVPENVSNTSHDEAQNTFAPKLAWYKGQAEGYGWVFNQLKQYNYPFMFSVNYKAGGYYDPILSYCDEKIKHGQAYLSRDDGSLILTDDGRPIVIDDGSSEFVIGKGLLRRFYLQRMAIMRNGQFYSTFFRLKNIDATNWLHREHILINGNRYELTEVKNYNPISDDSTECQLRKWTPVTQKDSDSVFPSQGNILGTVTSVNSFDLKYYPLLALSSDIKAE